MSRAENTKATASAAVYEKLRHDILAGDLSPGLHLSMDFVGSRYGAGAIPVREALNRLSSERLVDRKDQRGFFVPPVSIEMVRELVKTRCWMESKAIEESILNRTTAWEEAVVLAFHRLSRCPMSLEGQASVSNPEWEGYHQAFHIALISGCGSSWLIEFCRSMMDHSQRYRYIAGLAKKAGRDTVAEHRSIMDATMDGDVEKAKSLLMEHYLVTLRAMEGML